MRIVILYDPGAADWTPEDIRGVMKAVDEIGTIFAALGHEIRKVPVRHDLRWFAVARRAELVFNLCEGVHGKSEWEEHVVGALELDRKSTRLNSSHSQISYAVFCLKKKKKDEQQAGEAVSDVPRA